MATATTYVWNQPERSNEEIIVDFRLDSLYYGRYTAICSFPDGHRENIGSVYTEIEGEHTFYASTNREGFEIFPRTTDFSEVSKRFERYARLRVEQEKSEQSKEIYKHPLITNNLNLQNSNFMSTPTNQTQPKKKRINQFYYLESENVANDGHIASVGDAYNNSIGNIFRIRNDQTGKYEYVAYDHAGKFFAKSEKLFEVKREFSKNREQLLEEAHQRRIASKRKAIEAAKESREENKQQEREQELSDLRDDQANERGDIDVER